MASNELVGVIREDRNVGRLSEGWETSVWSVSMINKVPVSERLSIYFYYITRQLAHTLGNRSCGSDLFLKQCRCLAPCLDIDVDAGGLAQRLERDVYYSRFGNLIDLSVSANSQLSSNQIVRPLRDR